MMTTGRIPERQVVEGAILAMAMTMTMARVWSTHRVVRKGSGNGGEQWTGKGKGGRLRTGRGKGRRRGREMVNG
jgi:hypothetical protein